MEVTLTRSNKGGEKIFVGNFGYHFRSRNANGVYRWVCTHRKSMFCRSSVLTQKFGEEHKISRPPIEHNHPGLENEKVICKVNNYIETIAKEESTIKPSQMIQKVAKNVDPLVKEVVPKKQGAQVLKIQRARGIKRKLSCESDAHSSTYVPSHEKILKGSEEDAYVCWESADIQRAAEENGNMPNKSEEGINSSNTDRKESLHNYDVKFSPKRKPFVCSDQESDGTVNIRIFLEESLLSSFVINAQHTSNVNIRISKDDL